MRAAWLNVVAKRDGGAVPETPSVPSAPRASWRLCPRACAKNQKYPYKLPVCESTSSVRQSFMGGGLNEFNATSVVKRRGGGGGVLCLKRGEGCEDERGWGAESF